VGALFVTISDTTSDSPVIKSRRVATNRRLDIGASNAPRGDQLLYMDSRGTGALGHAESEHIIATPTIHLDSRYRYTSRAFGVLVKHPEMGGLK
jgi:hypothetical protein